MVAWLNGGPEPSENAWVARAGNLRRRGGRTRDPFVLVIEPGSIRLCNVLMPLGLDIVFHFHILVPIKRGLTDDDEQHPYEASRIQEM